MVIEVHVMQRLKDSLFTISRSSGLCQCRCMYNKFRLLKLHPPEPQTSNPLSVSVSCPPSVRAHAHVRARMYQQGPCLAGHKQSQSLCRVCRAQDNTEH